MAGDPPTCACNLPAAYLTLQLVEQLRTVEPRPNELADDERDVLLRQVLRAVPGKRDLDSAALELPVTRLLPR